METLEAFYHSTLAALKEANNEVSPSGLASVVGDEDGPLGVMLGRGLITWRLWCGVPCRGEIEVIGQGQLEIGESVLGKTRMDETQVGQSPAPHSPFGPRLTSLIRHRPLAWWMDLIALERAARGVCGGYLWVGDVGRGSDEGFDV